MSEVVKSMFSDISGQYDLLNDVLSLGRHRWWKKKFVKKINLPANGKHIDIATGTGDIATEIIKQYGKNVEVIGVDFSESMIIKARIRKDIELKNLTFEVGDATDLKFDDNIFNSSSISFGIRNIPDLNKAIFEMSRVIKPGGVLAIMEFGTPDIPFKWFYTFYSKYIIPFIGKIISGNDEAYTYLPETIKKFPYGNDFKELLNNTGLFSKIEILKLEFGTVYCYFCTKK
jgi:demethylmenaquinone methyltransferase/2-methoxy-6-polyprenyl-1,4-benzoquinol methylase